MTFYVNPYQAKSLPLQREFGRVALPWVRSNGPTDPLHVSCICSIWKILHFYSSFSPFIKWRLTLSYAAKDTIFWQKKPNTIDIRVIVLDDYIQINDNNFGYEKITILVDNIPLSKQKVKIFFKTVLTFIKWRLTPSYAAKDTIFWQKRPNTIDIRVIVLDDYIL
jgi:hypothetical protein